MKSSLTKLPDVFDESDLKDKVYRYTDAVDLILDLERIRRKLSYEMYGVASRKDYSFIVFPSLEGSDDRSVFKISAPLVFRDLWQRRYPNEPRVFQWRKWFTEGTLHFLCAQLNAIPIEEEQLFEDQPMVISRWDLEDL